MSNKKSSFDILYKKNILQQIRGFFYTVKFTSISKAAKFMNLTQSTVSLQIQALERDLKLDLFERNSKPLSLTKDGEEFYKIACPLMHQFESMIDNFAKKQDDNAQNKIEIAMHHIAISYILPLAASIFHKKYPKTQIIVKNIAASEASELLESDKIDLAFFPNFKEKPEISLLKTSSYNPLLIINKNNKLSKKNFKSLQDLRNFNLTKIDQKLVTLPLFEETLKIYKIETKIELENGNWHMLKKFVKSDNSYAAVVSEVCIDKNDNDLAIKDLSNFFPKMTYGIATRSGKKPRPIVQELIKALEESAKKRLMEVKKLIRK